MKNEREQTEVDQLFLRRLDYVANGLKYKFSSEEVEKAYLVVDEFIRILYNSTTGIHSDFRVDALVMQYVISLGKMSHAIGATIKTDPSKETSLYE
jgi:hypothetical protein